MVDLAYEQLHIGLSASFERLLKAEDLDAFAALSGDHNSLHTDQAYAVAGGFPGRVAHGMLSGALYSTLVGMHLPGLRALLMGIDISFHAPVFAGDRLTISGEITHRQDAFKLIEITAKIVDQDGRKLSKAKIKVGLRDA